MKFLSGSASRVLKITPSTREVELCGPEMTGKFKSLVSLVDARPRVERQC